MSEGPGLSSGISIYSVDNQNRGVGGMGSGTGIKEKEGKNEWMVKEGSREIKA